MKKKLTSQPAGEKFPIACVYSLVLFVGLSSYLLIEMTKPPSEPEEVSTDPAPAPETEEEYVPKFNTSGESSWHWGPALVITLAAGALCLGAPKII